MDDILSVAAALQRRAWQVLADTHAIEIWQSIGAEVNLVGSLRSGLLVRRLDIDLHLYTQPFRLGDSFAAMARLAENQGVTRITYTNLLDTDEMCLEWHARYRDGEGDLWQLDIIHLLRESPYAGYFERVADKIAAALTAETRAAILKLKYTLPADSPIKSIEVYKAVLQDGVRDYPGLLAWKERQADAAILQWEP